MSINTWPPEWWGTITDPDTWPDNDVNNFIKQLVIVMDILQWGHDFAAEVIEVIPHHPPKHIRPVVGSMGFNANGTNITVPMTLGAVGYDAVTRQVQWQVNEYGGFQKSEATFDISMMLPIIVQLTLMLPWNFQGELNKEFGKSGQALGQEVYEFMRTAMRGIDVTLPTLGIGDPDALVTKRHIELKSKVYTFSHNGFTYVFTIPKDTNGNNIVLEPDSAITVNMESVEIGTDAIVEGEIITIDFGLNTGQSVEASVGKVQTGSTNNKATLVIRNTTGDIDYINSAIKVIASSVPVMDLTQRFYDATKYMVADMYHHPPAFTKTVWAGGVNVAYRYYVHNTGEAKEFGVIYNTMPATDILNGKTLTVTAVFESKVADEETGMVVKKQHGEYILLTHAFNTWELAIEYLESDATYNEYRGAESSSSIVFVTALNTSGDSLPLRAGTYKATIGGNGFSCMLEYTNVIGAGTGTLMRFVSDDAGEFQVDAASITVTMTYGTVDGAFSFNVYDNYNTPGKVGRVGRVCTDPYESVGIEEGTVIKPHQSFFDTHVPANWIVESISHGTNYIAPIPATPVTDAGGAILFDSNGTAILQADGVQEYLAKRCKVGIRVKTNMSPVFDEATQYTPGDSLQILKTVHTETSPDGSLNLCLVAKDNQITSVKAGESFTIVSSIYELKGYVTSVVASGKSGPLPASAKVGSSLGYPAVLSIILVNESDNDIDLKEFMFLYKGTVLSTEAYPISIGDEHFVLTDIDTLEGILPAGSGTSANSIRFNAANTDTITFDKKIIEADVSFASTMFKSNGPKFILRWTKDKDLSYIGNALSLGGDVTWAAGKQQYLLCRLRYRLQEKSGRKEAFYHYVYTGDDSSNDYVKTHGADYRVPEGTMPIATIFYNAKEKSISVQNLQNGSIVKMRVNACLSFMIQHILLLPVQII